MKKTVSYWQAVGFVFTAVLGTLLHFLFDWTGGSRIAALFSAVNESIWEHLKLLYYPMLLFSLAEYVSWGKKQDSFWCIKLLGTLAGLVLIPVVYYTYTGIFGVSIDYLNIAIFFLAAGVSFWLETKLFQREFSCPLGDGAAFALLCLIGAVFTVLTFLPPQIPLFEDPITGTYGFCRKMDGQ